MSVSQFSHSLPMLLYAALDAVMPRFRLIFKEFGLTEQQWRILRVLWDIEEISHSELAAATLISAPSLVGVLDRLQSMELVVRRRSAGRRRRDADPRVGYPRVLRTGVKRRQTY